MLKAIIIDDEQHCVDRISKLLCKHNNTIDLVGISTTIEDAKTSIESMLPDVIFLDVHIHDKTGFDLLKQFSNIDCEIIFTTAYDRYAVDAFKFSALDYLLKPIDENEFCLAIEKIKKKASLKDISKKVEVLIHNLENKNQLLRKIAVSTSEGLTFVEVANIVRCQSDINYTHFFLKDKRKITVAKTIKHFENLLEQHNFFRIHKSHLINLSFVEKYLKGKGGYVLMSDKTHIDVAVRRKDAFLKKLSTTF
ncbi:LytTR family DNA-binding domain-containing protein [Yeosuana marina]|uniref:LytR/AlgR family response regulator transcription factor n=1 Tax=Yeosuana marina TaxID=1565536 RepID=UPI0030EDAF4E|tara:strand:- start:27 stop:779 length:753 start_codon:yes stop_codon:yes gene_type:complete